MPPGAFLIDSKSKTIDRIIFHRKQNECVPTCEVVALMDHVAEADFIEAGRILNRSPLGVAVYTIAENKKVSWKVWVGEEDFNGFYVVGKDHKKTGVPFWGRCILVKYESFKKGVHRSALAVGLNPIPNQARFIGPDPNVLDAGKKPPFDYLWVDKSQTQLRASSKITLQVIGDTIRVSFKDNTVSSKRERKEEDCVNTCVCITK